MEWLNYHHLYYFWTVVRLGSISKASAELRLASPTISAQIRSLEDSLGEKLLNRSGRRLIPTEMGRTVYRQADEIFALGREILDTVKHRPTRKPLRLAIGIDDVLPKEIAHRIIEPALRLSTPVRILCREASLERLTTELAAHELDVVLSDAQVTPTLHFRVYSHHLGDSDVVWMAAGKLANRYRRGFPKSLHGAPVLLPTEDTAIRLRLNEWFAGLELGPDVIGEFEDYALLRVFGQNGAGIFPVPSTLERQFRENYGMRRLGIARNVQAHFYAISAEEKIKHPGVSTICEAARRRLFA